MILIVGLGNPGLKYINNRHNIGFIIIDKIKKELNFPEFKEKFHSKMSKKKIKGVDVILLKPMTYMNSSGKAVFQCMKFFKIPTENIIIIHDDLDMKFLKVRIKELGSHGGHNGIRNIISYLGENFSRLKIGIKNDNVKDPKSFVLENFFMSEKIEFDLLVSRIIKNIFNLISKNFSNFLNGLKE